MPLRFYRRESILPGVRLNVSRSGPSLSLGVRGVHMTVGNRRGTRYSVGIPGTGLGWYKTVSPHGSAAVRPAVAQQPPEIPPPPSAWRWLLVPLHVTWFIVHGLLWISLRLLEIALLVSAGILAALFVGTFAGVAASGRRR